jgi:hypothetical protein
MPQGARLDSVTTLQDLKIALWKFQEAAMVGMADAESELSRMLMWVQNEQSSHWKNQIRIRQELVTRAKEAVRMKKVFKDASGRQQSAVDEEKVLQNALRRLAEAEHKLVMVKRWAIQLQKETELYKGGVQRFATSVQSDLPRAAAHLDALTGNIENYLATQAANAASEPDGAAISSVSRGQGETIPLDGPTIFEFKPAIVPVPGHHREAIARLDGHGIEPVGDEVVWISEGSVVAQSLRIFRTGSDGSKPGGWRIVPEEGPTSANWSQIEPSDLLRSRPDFAELLSLPSGFSVSIDNNGVAFIRDARERPVWQRGAD